MSALSHPHTQEQPLNAIRIPPLLRLAPAAVFVAWLAAASYALAYLVSH